MKKKLILSFLIPFFAFFAFSQVQIGSTIVGESAGDNSGHSVSVSGDGSTIAIGAPYHDSNGNKSGNVRIYRNESGIWNQINLDIDGEAEEDNFGFSVSLSNDGNTVAIGARFNGLLNFGHVRVFKNESGAWVQKGPSMNGNLADERFGWSLSLSGDGNIVAVGSPFYGESGNNNELGVARIFKHESGTWNQIGSDFKGAIGDKLGWSVSLSDDGNIAAIGIPYGKINEESLGLVKIYRNESGTWNQIGSDIQGLADYDETGYSVNLSGDGNVIVVGVPRSDINGNDSGAVRVYRNESDIWNQIGSDIQGVYSNDLFGYSVSLSDDGNIIAIGSPSDTDYVHIYENISGVWTLKRVFEGEKVFDWFGSSTSLSADGNTVVIGAPRNDDNGLSSGHVRAFDLNQILGLQENSIKNHFTIYPNPSQNELHINLNQSIKLIDIAIYNSLGRLIYRSDETKINISDFSSGIYFLEIETPNGKSTTKFIKE